MLNEYPVFRKDFRLLFKFMVGALAVQALVMLLVQLRPDRPHGGMRPQDWFPKMQIGVSAVMALVAAAYFLAEEREGGHDRFLFRLAASRKRIFAEKLAAGLAVVMLTLHLQFVWGLLGGKTVSGGVWAPLDIPAILTVLTAITLIAYLIGLPLSIFFRSTISVLLTGVGILSLGGVLVYFRYHPYGLWPLTWLFLYAPITIGLPVVGLILFGVTRRTKSLAPERTRSAVRSVLGKETREKMALHLAAAFVVLVVLGFTLAMHDTSGQERYILLVPIGILSTLIGVCAYSRGEKDGALCVLYHHPASLSRLFWLKFCHGLMGALVLDVLLLFIIFKRFNVGRDPDAASVAFVVFWGLIPYCCGVLFTHAFKHPLYATLAALFSIPVYSIPLAYLNWHFEIFVPAVPNQSVGFRPPFAWAPLLMVAGLTLAAWRTATDRAVLTGTTAARLTYTARLCCFVLAVVLLVEMTGWRDLFYLITNIDLGPG